MIFVCPQSPSAWAPGVRKRRFNWRGRKKARHKCTFQETERKKVGSKAVAMTLAFYGTGGVGHGVHDHFTSP